MVVSKPVSICLADLFVDASLGTLSIPTTKIVQVSIFYR